MNNFSFRIFTILIASSILVACSQGKKTTSTPAMNKVALTEEQMMENWKLAATPGSEHEFFKKLAGKWSTNATFWKDPSAKPEITKGIADNRLVLGGRFLQQSFKGKFMGQTFEGMGMLGYDNVQKSYISTWTDTTTTSIMLSGQGKVADNNLLEMKGEFVCPMTREIHITREVTKLLDKNKYVFEMYDIGQDGKEYKAMEIVYTRKG